jgi:hypothetical protein
MKLLFYQGWLIFTFFIIFPTFNSVLCQKKSDVNTGVFINSIYDLNFPEESFKIDMWLWCTYTDTSLKMNELIEFPKTKEFTFSNDVITKKPPYNWLTMRANGEILKKWDCKNFPFDKQMLNVTLGYSFDTSSCNVIADIKNSKIDPDFKLEGWNIDRINFGSGIKTYQTTFGDPSLKNGKSSYPEFIVEIFISRSSSLMTLIKLVLGLIIAFIISCCVFFIKPTNTDPRFGLCVGGLFTAVGNKYITDSVVPSTNEMTLVDYLHLITLVSIFLIIIQSVISLRIYEKKTDKSIKFSKQFDLYSFATIIVFFFTMIIGFTLNAMSIN